MTIFIQIGSAVICFLFSVFFSAAETALVSLSPQKSKSLALRNPALVPCMAQWLREPRELLILIVAGNTLVNVVFAAVMTSIAINTLPFWGQGQIELLAWFVETIFIIILAEMAPKFFARANPEWTAIIILPWLFRLKRLFRPFRQFLSAITTWVSWGKIHLETDKIFTFNSDEIKALLEERESVTTTPFEPLPMVKRTLGLQERQAQHIMTDFKNADFVEIDPPGKPPLPRDLLIDLIIENGRTRTPIKSQGKIVGFVHFDDFLPLILKDEGKDISLYIHKALDIPASRGVTELLHDFKVSAVHMGFVRNKRGEIIGIVTLEDIMEEITGEILDEYDLADSQGAIPKEGRAP